MAVDSSPLVLFHLSIYYVLPILLADDRSCQLDFGSAGPAEHPFLKHTKGRGNGHPHSTVSGILVGLSIIGEASDTPASFYPRKAQAPSSHITSATSAFLSPGICLERFSFNSKVPGAEVASNVRKVIWYFYRFRAIHTGLLPQIRARMGEFGGGSHAAHVLIIRALYSCGTVMGDDGTYQSSTAIPHFDSSRKVIEKRSQGNPACPLAITAPGTKATARNETARKYPCGQPESKR